MRRRCTQQRQGRPRQTGMPWPRSAAVWWCCPSRSCRKPWTASADPVERLLADSRAMYATMKYHAFKLQQRVQAQDLQIHGLQGKADAWEHWADQMRTQVAQLQAENAVLRAPLAECEPTPAGTPPGPAVARTVWTRLRKHVQGA